MRLNAWNDPPDAREDITAFLESQRRWERGLIAELHDHLRYGAAVTNERLSENLRLLQVWDYLSLLACMGPRQVEMVPNVPFEPGKRVPIQVEPSGMRTIRLEPFPLDGPLTVWLDARRLRGAPFDSEDALQNALDGAAYEPLALAIVGA